jgi:hypothetical protein
MSSEIRRIRLGQQTDDSGWFWTDAVTGETGHLSSGLVGLREDDECVVELAREGLSWAATRWLELPTHVALASCGRGAPEPEPVLVNGRPLPITTPRPARPDLSVGAIRLVYHHMDARSAAERDADRSTKSRPAVVLRFDEAHHQVEISFIYGTNSAIHRSGSGRRIRDWRAAGLRKPSVASAEIEVRGRGDLGPVLGHLSSADRERIIR